MGRLQSENDYSASGDVASVGVLPRCLTEVPNNQINLYFLLGGARGPIGRVHGRSRRPLVWGNVQFLAPVGCSESQTTTYLPAESGVCLPGQVGCDLVLPHGRSLDRPLPVVTRSLRIT